MGAVQKLSALFSIVRARHGWVQGRLIKQRMQISLFKARQTCWKRVQLSWSGKFHRSKTSVRPKDNSGKFSFSCHQWNLIKGEKALNQSVHERPDRCVIWIHTFYAIKITQRNLEWSFDFVFEVVLLNSMFTFRLNS